jgi:hypothetical protein
MDAPTPPPIAPALRTPGFPQQAAKASWASAVVVFLLLAFGGHVASRLILDRIALLLILAGLVLGITALFGIRKHGAKAILAPALVGIIVNGLLLFIFVTNFLAARAKARANANVLAPFLPAASRPTHAGTRRSYRSESIGFVYDGAYELRTNKETGQILLQHADSIVLVGNFGQSVDPIPTLKSQASALQERLRNQSTGGFSQTDVQDIAGAIRSGGFLRIEYDKVAAGRVHMDLYTLSDKTNSISLLHTYPDRRKASAQALFATVLRSLKAGE